MSYKWNHALGKLFCLASFNQHNYFMIYTSCLIYTSTCQNFIPFYCRGLFPYMYCKTIYKQKPQLNRIGWPEGGALIPRVHSPTGRRKTWQGSANDKPWTLVYCSPPNFLFPSVKAFSLPCPSRTCTWLADSDCSSLLIPNKPIFAGEILGSLFVSGQQYLSQYV